MFANNILNDGGQIMLALALLPKATTEIELADVVDLFC